MSDKQFVYRPVKRIQTITGDWTPWMIIRTGRGNGLYTTPGAARGVLTRERERERRYAERQRNLPEHLRSHVPPMEYRVDRAELKWENNDG